MRTLIYPRALQAPHHTCSLGGTRLSPGWPGRHRRHRRRAGSRSTGAAPPPVGSVDHFNKTLWVAALTSMVMLAIGVLIVAGEYRHRTIMQTYLGEPRRGRVLAAKAVTVAGIGAALGAVTFGMAYAVAVVLYGRAGWETLPVDVPQLWVGATCRPRCTRCSGSPSAR